MRKGRASLHAPQAPAAEGLGRPVGLGQNGCVTGFRAGAQRWLAQLGVALAGGALLAGSTVGCLKLREGDANAGPGVNPCVACHGSGARLGPVESQAAPPVDLDGNTDSSAPGVGAHEAHFSASQTHAPVPCSECHLVPTAVDSPGHADHPRPAAFVPGPLARLDGRSPLFDSEALTCSDVYCHRQYVPEWTRPRAYACGTCHSIPPPAPHVQTGQCSDCHPDIAPTLAFIRPDLHVNGGVDVVGACWDCHGTPQSFAPPPDLSGSSAVSSRGVGAHQAHLAGGSSSAPVACDACHVVPATNGAVGHIDGTDGAELTFTGVALVGGLAPSWDRQSLLCADTWCHSPYPSSGSPQPRPSPPWTEDLQGVPLPCTSCHDTPPAPPHPQEPDCTLCHASVVEGTAGNITIKDRSKHVNGVIDR